MEITPHRRNAPCSTLPPHRWPRVRALNDVCQLNGYVLESLSSLVASDASVSLSVVAENADLWRTLDGPSRMRAAQMPMLFLDLRFQDEVWWQDVASASACRCVHEAGPRVEAGQWLPGFTRQALMLAWPAVREDRNAAILLFGMSDAVAAVIASLNPQQLDHLSLHHSHEMRLRWNRSHGFWRKLLLAAQSGDMEMLRELHLCGLQLIGGEMMRIPQWTRIGKVVLAMKLMPGLLSPPASS